MIRFIIAPLAALSLAFLAALLVDQPGDFPWGIALYVVAASAFLVGVPTLLITEHLKAISLGAYVSVAAGTSIVSSLFGAAFLYWYIAYGTTLSIGEPIILLTQPWLLILFIAGYVGCGSLAAAVYWALGRLFGRREASI